MHVEESDFKKLLIDLGLTLSDVARPVGITSWAVTLYFRGKLKAPETRVAIKKVLVRRARRRGIPLPRFWPDSKTA